MSQSWDVQPVWRPERRPWGLGDLVAVLAWTVAIAAFFWDAVGLRGALFYFDISEINYPYRDFFARESSVAAVRRAETATEDFPLGLWRGMAALGWLYEGARETDKGDEFVAELKKASGVASAPRGKRFGLGALTRPRSPDSAHPTIDCSLCPLCLCG